MAKTLDATFDPSNKWNPIEEGTYPAHITTLSTREMNTRAGEAIIVNMTYKVNEAVSETEQLLWEMDGYNYKKDSSGQRIPTMNGSGDQSTMPCSHLKDRTFYDNGFFIFTDTSSASKNSRYFQLLENLGVKCEDSNGIKKLVLLEEEDVIGKPVYVTVKRQEYVTKDTKHLSPDQQEKRTSFKVSEVKSWEEGPTLSSDELEDDVPF
tara:strand:+ start:1778 stop:2401 length:624 start_codon:yes stop_codon:yes gene_type:complete